MNRVSGEPINTGWMYSIFVHLHFDGCLLRGQVWNVSTSSVMLIHKSFKLGGIFYFEMEGCSVHIRMGSAWVTMWNNFVICQMNKYHSSLVDRPTKTGSNVRRFPWSSPPCLVFSWANSWISMCLLPSEGLPAHSKLRAKCPSLVFSQLSVTPHLPCHLQSLGIVFLPILS